MKTLLVVEDEKMIRKGICAMIQRSGVPVETILEASNGEAALEVLAENKVDVMFTDIRMPKMDGIELVQKVQELEDKPLIVAVSGYDDFSYAVEMLRNGVREYLLKPVEREKVKETLVKLNNELENISETSRTDKKFGEQQLCAQRIQLIGTTKTDELISGWDDLFEEISKERISTDEFIDVMDYFIAEVDKIYHSYISEDDKAILEKLKKKLAFPNLREYQEVLMSWIIELHNRINSDDSNNRNQQKMLQAIEYIEKNYDSDINMAVVSNYVSMNYSLFSFSFKQYTGKNFVNYLKEIRVREAQKLLAETDMKVIEISQQVGCDNEKHFTKMFKSVCGVSPTEYRRNTTR